MRLLSPRDDKPTNSGHGKPNVKRLIRDGDVGGLAAVLGYREIVSNGNGSRYDLGVPLRIEALTALAGSPDPRAQKAVETALTDASVDVRLVALRSARDLGSEQAIRALAYGLGSAPIVMPEGADEASRYLAHKLSHWVKGALEALAGLDDPRALEQVATYMIHRDGQNPLGDNDLAVIRNLRAGPRTVHALPDIAHRLALWLAHESEGVVTRAGQVLTACGGAGLNAVVCALDDPTRRVVAIGLLGDLKDKQTSSSLAVYADDPDPAVRCAVMEALGKLRDPTAVRVLLSGANDDDYDVRETACQALDGVGTAAFIVAVTSVVGPTLERIAETTEVLAASPDGGRAPEITAGPDTRTPLPPEEVATQAPTNGATRHDSSPHRDEAHHPSRSGREMLEAMIGGRTAGEARQKVAG